MVELCDIIENIMSNLLKIAQDIIDNKDKPHILGGLGGLGGGAISSGFIAENYNRNKLKNTKLRELRNKKELLKNLMPGDILVTRTANPKAGKFTIPTGKIKELFKSKGWDKSSLGKRILKKLDNTGVRMSDLISTSTGSPYAHTSMYIGKDSKGVHNIVDTWDNKAKIRKLKEELSDRAHVIYRPRDRKLSRKAVEKAKEMASKGFKYRSKADVLNYMFRNFFGKGCKLDDKAVCSELIAKAYPDIFKNKAVLPSDFSKVKGLKSIGRFGTDIAPLTNIQKILTYGTYPLLKSLKYALPAGVALGYSPYLYDKIKSLGKSGEK